MTRLLLIRHGETDWNIEGRWQGQEDIPLNQRGREQAERMAELLEEHAIDAIYSSDLQRAHETARIVAEEKGLPIHVDPRLREIHQGEWQGLLVKEIETRYADLFKERSEDPYNIAPPGGESTFEVRERVLEFLKKIEKEYPDSTVAIVSHGFTLAVIQTHYLNEPFERVFDLVPKNGELIILDLAE